MGKINYYCSGWDREKGFNEEWLDYLKKDIKSFNKLVFIPTSLTDKEKIKNKVIGFTETFIKGGFEFKSIITLNPAMGSEKMNSNILTADVVFLMGGNPSTQLDFINLFNLDISIKKTEAVVIGTSAGAMCMSDYSILLPINDKYPDLDIRKGMNLSGINVYPHYNSNGTVPEILIVNTEKTKRSDLVNASTTYGAIYLLPDDSGIREQNGILSFIGEGIIKIDKTDFKNISTTNS